MAGTVKLAGLGRLAAIAIASITLSFGLLGWAGGAMTEAQAGAAGDCPHADDAPGEATVKQFRRAIRCLIAERRERKDLRRLRPNGALDSVAQRHTRVMLKKDCFAHKCPGEKPVLRRIEDAGYPRPGDRFRYAENTGYSGTPKLMLTAPDGWMHSKFHRRNILGKRWLHIGVGAGRGIPVEGADDETAMTYTVLFAWRKQTD